MKKVIFLLVFLFPFLAESQQYSAINLLKETEFYSNLIEGKYKAQIIKINLEITSGLSNNFVYLVKDNVYSFMVLIDTAKIKNADIIVYENRNNKWVKVAEDTKTEKIALLNFTPNKNDIYKLEILAEFKENSKFGFYSLIIFR